ncbi:primosomal protein N' [Robbsia sp. Bb-Pol-6]|uniref:Replication restart protein PriA n=1 Tax=Robbsia betulipollinis TaxID=2981849 RepID=A0ABT3ZRH7_9BURK|nr:primosomal protein N' [Robbsia betulipollinis]MCY0389155.1 primosomal protein N' [Robbsia betulipollinis]
MTSGSPGREGIVRVALDHPLQTLFDYRYTVMDAASVPVPGQLVCVPFGRRQGVGLVCEVTDRSAVPAAKLKPIEAFCTDCPPLGEQWLGLVRFAAGYYQRGIGEVAMPALPQALRDPARWSKLFPRTIVYDLLPAEREALFASLPARAAALRRLADALCAGRLPIDVARRLHPRAGGVLDAWCAAGWLRRSAVDEGTRAPLTAADAPAAAPPVRLSDEQETALAALRQAEGFAPFLLFGVTGSGKTEVYLHALADRLARDPEAQALVLVPEINLTPQFDALFRRRFAALGDGATVTLHSGLAEGERARHWLAAHTGRARIVLGTRLAVLASFRKLAMIIVDEEHEAAYKQQEGLRYSARDLAIWRAKQLALPIVLGSATPSLETWSQAEQGRYRRLTLTRRPASAEAALPTVRLIDTETERQRGRASIDGFSTPLATALRERLTRGEQSLVFINRRGYAPVLSCDACGWVCGCPRCSAYLVLHKKDRVLRCHHCGWQERIPHACPECGNVDIAPMGRGTQRAEETLATLVPGARILRIDADSTRRKGSAAALFADVHAGDVDILVGTHMIAKGHDFQNVSLVAVLNADAALFSHDFRATERLFAQLMQVAGRAGRGGQAGEVLIQTRHPSHPLYAALIRHDYAGFAAATLAERKQAHLPPFVYQALLRAEARTLEQAIAFLQKAAESFDLLTGDDMRVHRYDPVPMALVKIANTFRGQLLIESASRQALQATLHAWQEGLRRQRGGVLRWAVEIDPLDI